MEPNGNAVYTMLKLQELMKGIERPKVVIVGLGVQGRMMMYIASQLMGMEVVGVDKDPSALEACKRFGSVVAIDDPRRAENITAALGGEADAIIDACGATGIAEMMSGHLRDKGHFILFGLLDKDQPLLDTKLETFVIDQGTAVVARGGKTITYMGLCGRSPEAWRWLIDKLEKDDEIAGYMLQRVVPAGSLDTLASCLAVSQRGDQAPLVQLLNSGKVVMSGFSQELLARLSHDGVPAESVSVFQSARSQLETNV